MVKEASLIKQKQKDIVKGKKGRDVQSERHLKESIIGQINILSKKSRTTRIEEDDIDEPAETEIRQSIKFDGNRKNLKNFVHFENNMFKNI